MRRAIPAALIPVCSILALFQPDFAWATCTPAVAANTTTVCSGTTTVTAPLGSGPSGPDNVTITIQPSASVTAGNVSVISLRDYATISLGAGALVQNAATSGGGLWASGNDTIEFRSYGSLTIAAGASVRSTGSATNAEAVNLMGGGNSVTNYGLIYGNNAAIWFEDRVDVALANTIDNYGTIQSGSGQSLNNVIGNQGNGNEIFINRSSGIVYGSLSFANGNDSLTLYAGSLITGGFNGGGGTNSLTLHGTLGSSDTLVGNITNFQTLIKDGEGTWTLSGSVGNNSGGTPLAVTVQQGTLALTGNNTSFNGSVVVDPAGILQARAQSLPPSVIDNGLVWFTQPDNGIYAGAISGDGAVLKTDAGVLTLTGAKSYAGGTTIQGGTIAVSADSNLGAPSGSLTFDGGALELTSSFNMPSRAISIT
ncbi:MAG: autotransporter-associated beta strand repeat-containing protein, partial [Betaproteobacteria bacterium]|nr:autotransporter-associated beta strand repeat-containing protein [Betaproteobacteria bacterium]